jgi:hypothetical protein
MQLVEESAGLDASTGERQPRAGRPTRAETSTAKRFDERTLQRGLPSGSRRQRGVLVVWQLLQMVGASPDDRAAAGGGGAGGADPSGVALSLLAAPGVGGVDFFSALDDDAFLLLWAPPPLTRGPFGTAELTARSAGLDDGSARLCWPLDVR